MNTGVNKKPQVYQMASHVPGPELSVFSMLAHVLMGYFMPVVFPCLMGI